MLLYSEHSHKTCSTDSHSHSQKNKLYYCSSTTYMLPSSSFRPDLNLNKSLKPMSDSMRLHVSTSCTQTLLSTLYILSIYSSYTFQQATYNVLVKKFLNALFIQDKASLEPSEKEVRSISLIIYKAHFFHCFLFLPGILHLFHSFSIFFFCKNYLHLF